MTTFSIQHTHTHIHTYIVRCPTPLSMFASFLRVCLSAAITRNCIGPNAVRGSQPLQCLTNDPVSLFPPLPLPPSPPPSFRPPPIARRGSENRGAMSEDGRWRTVKGNATVISWLRNSFCFLRSRGDFRPHGGWVDGCSSLVVRALGRARYFATFYNGTSGV